MPPRIGKLTQTTVRILCDFGIDEISEAFLSNKETINKRLFRAKEKLRTENVQLELPSEREKANRLTNVLHIIYLLFNEGYYSKTRNTILRKDLCLEAMRLGLMLTGYKGASLALEDSAILAKCLSKYDNTEVAFSAFQTARQIRVEKIIIQARKIGKSKSKPNALSIFFRDIFLRYFINLEKKKMDWIYGYDTDEVLV